MAGRRNLIFAGALVGLIALVAVASRGHSPAGNGPTHSIDSRVIWEFVLLAVLALSVICLPVALWVFGAMWLESAESRLKRRQRTAKRALASLAIVLVVALLAVLRADSHHDKAKPLTTGPSGVGLNGHGNPGKQIPFDWLPAIVMLSVALVGAAVVAYVLFRKPPKRRATQAELAAQLSAVLDDSLDDLLGERDPRKAVIATYARMETTLAGAGLPRAVAETPLEYLGRALRELLHTSADAVARLTALFERAKFSTHEIDAGMKKDAIDALVTVRDELRAAT
jgi:NADH:ubiquinone oxidoreductase subunit 6 (subunit J)